MTPNMEQGVKQAVEILKNGGIILYPTDTVWGVGCDATNGEAVSKIYALKKSENKTAMIILCNTLDMAARYISRPPMIAFEVMEVATKPLTAIMPGGVGVAPNLIPEEGTLAIRIPDHEFCQEVIRRLGRPLVSTSANISGEATPKRLDDICKEIVEGVDYIVSPKLEGKPTKQPSSIIKFEMDNSFKIIRE
ncbi:MAG: L-threonylcarbamoyladenylate synthase [Rikenellaceae bacterium]